jgi:type IV pilus assembly protein PilY1
VASTVAVCLILQTSLPAYAGMSQLPAVYTSQPDANVMFTLDDSGSMASDLIPDVTGGTAVADGFPSGSAWYYLATKYPLLWTNGSAFTPFYTSAYYPGFANASPTSVGDDSNVSRLGRYLRSPDTNPLYYNPAKRYTPWPDPADDTKPLGAGPTTSVPAVSTTAVRLSLIDGRASSHTVNLTMQRSVTTGSGQSAVTTAFWPATYYRHNNPTGYNKAARHLAGENLAANYTKVEIKPGGGPYAKSSERTDCLGATNCTPTEELQNFAHWLQYYRNRMLMAKGGVALAFAQQSNTLRVGYTSINYTSTAGIRQGVSAFTGTQRSTFYTNLYGTAIQAAPNYYTPLRRAVQKVGEYFTLAPGLPLTDPLRRNSPWAFAPGTANTLPEYECRKSFHILSTDGYWTNQPVNVNTGYPGDAATGAAAGDNDVFAGQTTPTRPGLTPLTTLPGTAYDNLSDFKIDPFQDRGTGTGASQANTLSDATAYYWKTDLAPSLGNRVIPTSRDPAYWQHLTTFTVGLGIDGTGAVPGITTQAGRDALVRAATSTNWPTVIADGPTTGDDLIRAAMVSRGRNFTATDPSALSTGIASALAEAANQPLSLTSISPTSGSVMAGGRVYQATFNPSQWYGRLYAFSQSTTASLDTSLTAATWEASNMMPAHGSRKIFTYNPGTITSLGNGTLFDFSAGGLTAAQRLTLDNNLSLLNYLRGDATNEFAGGVGTFRDRQRYTRDNRPGGVLGDIVNSTPVQVPEHGYGTLPITVDGAGLYAAYRSSTNPNIQNYIKSVFVGANDGMLHAFNSVDGVERFGFVPSAIYTVPRSNGLMPENKLKMLADQAYTHRFTVDGTPQLSDAFLGGATGSWRAILNGTTGAGGRSIFAIDVTEPSTGPLGTFGAGKVLWELSDATLDPEVADNMGYILNYGHVALMSNNQWALIYGNGYDSARGQAVLFIRDLATGAKIATIPVGPVPAPGTAKNGLSQPNFVLEGRKAKYIYAGDLRGNMWKFDVSSVNPSDWGSAFGTTLTPAPLYTTPTNQPITVMPTIYFRRLGTADNGVMLTFGTGKLFDTEDNASGNPPNVNLTTQAIYGIWDKPNSGAGYATSNFSGLSELIPRSMNTTLAIANDTSLTGTNNTVPTLANPRGWYFNLPTSGERVNVNPQLPNASNPLSPVIVVANTPSAVVPCVTGGTARVFAFDPVTGAAPDFALYDANRDGSINRLDKGYNVWSLDSVVNKPVFQSLIPSDGQLKTKEHDDKRTGAFDGGREKGDPSRGDCRKRVTLGKTDTTAPDRGVMLCPGEGRISWRQIQ